MTSSVNPKTILLRGGDPVYVEARATASILPGQVIVTTGQIRTGSAEPTAALAPAGSPSRVFARENESIGGRISDAYAENDNVLGFVAKSGDVVYAWLAAGQNIAAGANLSVGANGILVAATVGATAGSPEVTSVTFPTPVIARALQTINNSAGGAVPVRIKVEIV